MTSPVLTFPKSLWQRRELWWNLSRREVSGRYRGSVLGWSWSFLTPLLMLAVYTFVFSEVFQSRWEPGSGNTGTLEFAINLFAGLIAFNLFSECANKAPTLILSNSNYVTKVVFPLEILAAVTVAAASFHAFTSVLILALFQLLGQGSIPLTIVFLPLIWLPLLLGCLGLTWLLAALGVFLRDISQVVGVAVSMLMFLSAVFYPVTALPERWRPLLSLNPLVRIIEQTRRVCVNGLLPQPLYLLVGMGMGLLVCELGYRSFQKSRRAFADVM
ncbi:MAG: ABC transporter permease [Synechococcaceae cyanobacterium]|nr:ABC transporter permease [Synechococcaceae cyanobacterium]